MGKRPWFLLAIALLMGALYVYFFTDWFKPKIIQISHTERPMPMRFLRGAAIQVITFGLDRPYRLNELTVVPLAEYETNNAVHPVWHLISDSKSQPTKMFRYGATIRGMKPAVPGAGAESLQTNLTYRLLLRSGSIKGQHDFHLGVVAPGAPGS